MQREPTSSFLPYKLSIFYHAAHCLTQELDKGAVKYMNQKSEISFDEYCFCTMHVSYIIHFNAFKTLHLPSASFSDL